MTKQQHRVKYPGLDAFYCDLCQKWVCRQNEIDRLEAILLKLKDGKAKTKLYLEISQAKQLMQECKPVDKQS